MPRIPRASILSERATSPTAYVLYRHDLNFGNEGVPPDPHAFMSSPNAPAHYSRVTLGAQQQIATFFASDGTRMIHPTPTELWEVPDQDAAA